MQARMDFYDAPQVIADVIYNTLRTTTEYTVYVAAPNNGLYNIRQNMSYQIQQALDITVGALESFDQCESVSLIHPRDRSASLEVFVDAVLETNGSFNIKYWEVLPDAESDPLCSINAASSKCGDAFIIFCIVMILCICNGF